jgi:hypothetical protein
MPVPDASKLLLVAGRDVLSPLGITPRGRGRNWLDDHGRWIVNVEFQPSGWSKGSYLNVGVQWLWKPFPTYAFEYGDRVRIPANGEPTQFVEFETESQSAKAARDLVTSAAAEVLRYRQLFRTLGASIKVLHKKESLYRYDLAVAYGLIGKDHEARRLFGAARVKKAPRDWEIELNALMSQLASLARDKDAFRTRVLDIVNDQRRVLKLKQDRVVELPSKL